MCCDVAISNYNNTPNKRFLETEEDEEDEEPLSTSDDSDDGGWSDDEDDGAASLAKDILRTRATKTSSPKGR